MSSEKPLPKINFFICTTFEDLQAHRDAVIKKIRSHAGVINAQEFFGARDQKPLETCLEEVGKSQVFVMFLGPRYGSQEPISGKSFVECEYLKAKDLKLPRLAYIIDDGYSFPIKHVSTTGDEAEKLRRFKAEVRAELTVDQFTGPDDLAGKVYQDLLRELPKHGFKVGEEPRGEKEPDVRTLIKNFLTVPKLFYGHNIRWLVKLGDYSRASESACRAFSFTYGAAVRRGFTVSEKDMAKFLQKEMGDCYVFAEDEDAEDLIDAPSGAETLVVMKTIQGEYETESAIYGDQGPLLGVSSFPPPKVVVGYKTERHLLCAFGLVNII